MLSRFEALKKHNGEAFEKAVKEGKADTPIIPLCRFLNETKNYYTSSSCSGRITLLKMEKDQTKKEASFHRRWHETVGFEEFWKAINEKTERKELWVKQEPFILHIGTNNIENAKKVLSIMKKAGVKRGGINLVQKDKILLEVTGTHNLTMPIKTENKMLLSREYLEIALEKANRKMEENGKRLKKFEETCRKELE